MADFKVTADHLRRDAYLYVRQSTLRQVTEHGESTQRQYALRDSMLCGIGQPPRAGQSSASASSIAISASPAPVPRRAMGFRSSSAR